MSGYYGGLSMEIRKRKSKSDETVATESPPVPSPTFFARILAILLEIRSYFYDFFDSGDDESASKAKTHEPTEEDIYNGLSRINQIKWDISNIRLFWKALQSVLNHDPSILVIKTLLAIIQSYKNIWKIDFNYSVMDSAMKSIYSQSAATALSNLIIAKSSRYEKLLLVISEPHIWTFLLAIRNRIFLELLVTLWDQLEQILITFLTAKHELAQQCIILKKRAELDLGVYEDPKSSAIVSRADARSAMGSLEFVMSTFSLLLSLTLLGRKLTKQLSKDILILPLIMYAVESLNNLLGKLASPISDYDSPQHYRLQVSKSTLEDVNLKMEVSLFNASDYFFDEFVDSSRKLMAQGQRGSLKRGVLRLLLTLTNSLKTYGLMAYLAIGPAFHNTGYAGYTRNKDIYAQLDNYFDRVKSLYQMYHYHLISLKTYFDFMDLEPQIKCPKNPLHLARPKGDRVSTTPHPEQPHSETTTSPYAEVKDLPLGTWGIKIEFRNVTYQYSSKTAPAVENVSFVIYPGDAVALLGENGSGKSTIMKLICRLYKPTSGTILFDDIDADKLDPRELHDIMSAVLQAFSIFNLTVRENIGIARVEFIKDQQIIEQAAIDSGADDFIQQLEEKYESMDLNVSGGQRQKIALARAFMRTFKAVNKVNQQGAKKVIPARLLILDEPTSALDSNAEVDIFGNIYSLMSGDRSKSKHSRSPSPTSVIRLENGVKVFNTATVMASPKSSTKVYRPTTILVTHRFGVVPHLTNKILVMGKGKLVEQGTHSELADRNNGIYNKLYHSEADAFLTAK